MERPARSERSRWPVAALALALATALLHAAWIGQALTIGEANAGQYFGITLKVWAEFGLAEMRGMPVWLCYPATPSASFLYPNHPPGLFWIMYALGTEEWALRLPGVVAAWLGGLAMFRLLEARLGFGLGLAAAFCLLTCPGLAVVSVASYENVVVAFGLWLWFVTLRMREAAGSRRVRLGVLQAALVTAGTWMDWQMAFWVAGLAPLVVRSDLRTTARALVLPGVVALLAAASVFAWRAWAMRAPSLAGAVAPQLGDLISNALARPRLGAWLQACGQLLVSVAGPVAVAVAVPGVIVLAARQARLALALIVAGLGPVAVFSQHALDHAVFYTLATPLVVVAAFAIPALLSGRFPRVAASLAVLLVVAGWVASEVRRRGNHTELLKQVGEAMAAEATRDGVVVMTDFPAVFQYYVDSPLVITQCITNPSRIESSRGLAVAARGIRFLWWAPRPGSPLVAYLQQSDFPRRPCPIDARMPVGWRPFDTGPLWVEIPPK